ncbi:MAG: Mur ligase family protein, partial [Oscillospiraceae bacterium]|nr:Mur ligase family protein [Oscillospiraceae bacterium]
MKKIKYIHVAGTNGKGSTCAFIARGLIYAGYRVGKFTSPHVIEITERITVNDEHIPLSKIPDLSELSKTGFFKTLWKIALEYFVEQQVDYAVIETGIGGLHDCTNTDVRIEFEPVLSVITKIGFDHMEILGNTIQEIATHKAGIIRSGVPVVTDPTQLADAMKVISDTAERKGSQLVLGDLQTPHAHFLECNKSVAIAALKLLGVTATDKSLENARPLARMQRLSENPLVIVDGAHNPDAIKALVSQIVELPHTNKIVMFGTQSGKDYDGCIKALKGINYSKLLTVSDVSCETEVLEILKEALASASASVEIPPTGEVNSPSGGYSCSASVEIPPTGE